jgi:hypothetical protein
MQVRLKTSLLASSFSRESKAMMVDNLMYTAVDEAGKIFKHSNRKNALFVVVSFSRGGMKITAHKDGSSSKIDMDYGKYPLREIVEQTIKGKSLITVVDPANDSSSTNIYIPRFLDHRKKAKRFRMIAKSIGTRKEPSFLIACEEIGSK